MCADVGLSSILYVVKRIILIIQIVAPILLIIMASISFFSLVKNPDEQKEKKKLRNRFIAAMVIFFVPMIVNVFMGILGEKTNFSNCWINATKSNSSTNYISDNSNKAKIIEDSKYDIGDQKDSMVKKIDRSVLSKNGVSNNSIKSMGDDHYQLSIGDVTYEVYGQNESGFSNELLSDNRTISTGGCGPTALATALSSFGYKGNPYEVHKAGSYYSVETHVKAIENLKKDGKLSKYVKVDAHSEHSLPNDADSFYQSVKNALMDNHAVVMDIREGNKSNNNFCNIYGTGDYYEGEGAMHAHWTAIVAYDPSNDLAFFANSCGSKLWFSLRTIMDLTFEAVSGQAECDEGWVGSWVEIYV